jgi:NAD(P)-dependent dehydrogenase (short-subunit alcohol dehydrogenase family)
VHAKKQRDDPHDPGYKKGKLRALESLAWSGRKEVPDDYGRFGNCWSFPFGLLRLSCQSNSRGEEERPNAVRYEVGCSVSFSTSLQRAGVLGDVSNVGDLDRLFAQIVWEKGKLDVVFANDGSGESGTFGEITEEHYASIVNANVKGVVFIVQKARPLVSDGDSIILHASTVASKEFWTNSVYSATRAAVHSFAPEWTTHLKNRRVRVNAVGAGATATPGLNDAPDSTEARDVA